jgi:hypothetical protein
MMQRVPLSRYAPTAHRFDFMVTLSVIGLFATWLLHSLNDAQADIEKAILETELNNLRLSITEVWVQKSIENKSLNLAAFTDSNPMLLIAEKPKNYIGERAQTPKSNEAIWYFDTQKKCLIYVFKDGRQAAYKLAGMAGLTLVR